MSYQLSSVCHQLSTEFSGARPFPSVAADCMHCECTCATLRETSSDPEHRPPQSVTAPRLRPAAWTLPLPCGILRHPVSVDPTTVMDGCRAHATLAVLKQQQQTLGIVSCSTKIEKGGRSDTAETSSPTIYACRNLAQHTHARCRQRQATLRRRRGSAAVRHMARPRLFRYLGKFRHAGGLGEPSVQVMSGNIMGDRQAPDP